MAYGIFDLCSFNDFSVLWITESASFFKSTNSLLALSSSLYFSDLLIISYISASDKPPEEAIVIEASFPVALSLAEMLTIPLASISKVTSI